MTGGREDEVPYCRIDSLASTIIQIFRFMVLEDGCYGESTFKNGDHVRPDHVRLQPSR